MSTDPLLPSSDDPHETTIAAEPGSGGPVPQFAEEPDRPDQVLGDDTDGSLDDAIGDQRTPFTTPTPGERLSSGDLEADQD